MNAKKYFLLIIIFALSIQSIKAQKYKNQFNTKINVSSIYDDNVLKYSDKYITRFINNEDEGRFDIKTYDDVLIKTKLGVSYSFYPIKKKKSKLTASFQNSNYINNSVKNWNIINFGFQQYLTKKLSFRLLYSYIPEFYVRNYRNDSYVSIYGYTPDTFKPFSFSKDNFGFWIQNTFYKKTKIRLNIAYQLYYHNQYYTEYDAKNTLASLRIQQKINKKISLSALYQYTNSNAKGYNQQGETKENSNDTDASFNEHKYELKLNVKLPKILSKLRNEVTLKTTYSQRLFNTEKLIINDPLHVGRLDNNLSFALNYTIKFNKKTQLGILYNYNQRKSSNNSVESLETNLSNEKDYNQNQLGLSLSYTIF